jgi:GTP-binding protein Era
VGKGGDKIRRIGTRARPAIERLVGTRVHLELFVKVDPKWLKSRERIELLGYH